MLIRGLEKAKRNKRSECTPSEREAAATRVAKEFNKMDSGVKTSRQLIRSFSSGIFEGKSA